MEEMTLEEIIADLAKSQPRHTAVEEYAQLKAALEASQEEVKRLKAAASLNDQLDDSLLKALDNEVLPDLKEHLSEVVKMVNENRALKEAAVFFHHLLYKLTGVLHKPEEGLDPTMYHTNTYKGDLQLYEEAKKREAIINKKEQKK